MDKFWSFSKKDKIPSNYKINRNGKKYDNDTDFVEKARFEEPRRNDKWVIACHYKDDPKLKMAVKNIKIQSDTKLRDFEKLREEIEAFRKDDTLRYIVGYYGICYIEEPLTLRTMICNELMTCSLASVYEWCHNEKEWTTNPEKREKSLKKIMNYVVYNLIKALNMFFHHNLVHQNIKPGNILFNETGKIKLCDYRITKSMISSNNSDVTTFFSSTKYLAPEAKKKNVFDPEPKIDHRGDVWSFGMTLAEIVCGAFPLEKCTKFFEIKKKIENEDFHKEITKKLESKSCPEDLIEFIIKNCLKVNRDERPDSVDLQKTKFYITLTKEPEIDKKKIAKLIMAIPPKYRALA